MSVQDVYVEVGADGECMAHVLDLPGCISRGHSQDEALDGVPPTVTRYQAWLERHGERVDSLVSEPVTVRVVETIEGAAPFRHGDPAALFQPDRIPMQPEDVERYFRLSDYARADLLRAARGLPPSILRWKLDADAMSVQEILRHVGNCEQWYVSRVVSKESLPPEWEHDQALPLHTFLRMERRTAHQRLRQMGDRERAEVVFPTTWTTYPDEPWAARKALRRMVEHELEHTEHVHEVLRSWRAHLRARLAAERAGLLRALTGLDQTALSGRPVIEDWTAVNLLVHVGSWDEFFAERIEMHLAGRQDAIAQVDLDQRNARTHAERRDWTLERSIEAAVQARKRFLDALARVDDTQLHAANAVPWGGQSIRAWAEWRGRHDREHARELLAWRRDERLDSGIGPAIVLETYLRAARKELLSVVALVPARRRPTQPVTQSSTLQELLGRLSEQEQALLDELRTGQALTEPRQRDAGTAPQASWQDTWYAFHTVHHSVLRAVANASDAQLASRCGRSGQPIDTLYRRLLAVGERDQRLAAELRSALELRVPPRLLARQSPA
ncbi:MAG: type II toxin-antitoxin system HicB family antitoxin [Chloroflexota bacterium]|nr:type II toxin-antitoxin system HicB family antitoxin [Chloroflexota bacterium]